MTDPEIDGGDIHPLEIEITGVHEPQTAATKPVPHPQPQSVFFSTLPLEIRQNIYSHLWQATGPIQHVYKSSASPLAPLSHCPCIANLDAEDIREDELSRVLNTPAADPATLQDGVGPGSEEEREAIQNWRFRIVSSWCNHWKCEEEPPILRELQQLSLEDSDDGEKKADESSKGKRRQILVKEYSPFLATLLTCKRMQEEAIDSLYNDTTFSFINTDALTRFLGTTSTTSLARIKKLHFTWRAPIETYMDPEADEVIAERIKWCDAWTSAADKLPRLQELRIWAYPYYARYPTPFEEWFEPLHQFGRHKMPASRFHVSLRWFQNNLPEMDTGPLDFLEAAPFGYDMVPPCQENPLHFHWRRLVGLGPDEPRVPITRRQRKRRYVGRAL